MWGSSSWPGSLAVLGDGDLEALLLLSGGLGLGEGNGTVRLVLGA